MPFRAPFGTDVYVRNRLRIADSIPVLAGTDSFLGTADLRLRDRFPESGISEFVRSEIHESMISERCSTTAPDYGSYDNFDFSTMIFQGLRVLRNFNDREINRDISSNAPSNLDRPSVS